MKERRTSPILVIAVLLLLVVAIGAVSWILVGRIQDKDALPQTSAPTLDRSLVPSSAVPPESEPVEGPTPLPDGFDKTDFVEHAEMFALYINNSISEGNVPYDDGEMFGLSALSRDGAWKKAVQDGLYQWEDYDTARVPVELVQAQLDAYFAFPVDAGVWVEEDGYLSNMGGYGLSLDTQVVENSLTYADGLLEVSVNIYHVWPGEGESYEDFTPDKTVRYTFRYQPENEISHYGLVEAKEI